MSKLDDLFWWTMDAASENGILPVAIPKDKFKDRVKKVMLELIGNDADDFMPGDSEFQDGVNTLRAELRQKVDEL